VAEPLKPAADALKVARPRVADQPRAVVEPKAKLVPPTAVENATPKATEHALLVSHLEPRPEPASSDGGSPPSEPTPLPPNLAEVDRMDSSSATSNLETRAVAKDAAQNSPSIRDPALASDRRLRPERNKATDLDPSSMQVAVARKAGRNGSSARGGRGVYVGTDEQGQGSRIAAPTDSVAEAGEPIFLARATPKPRVGSGTGSGLAEFGDRVGGQNLAEIPQIYQPRLEPDRSTRAQGKGASAASERAVERALDWLTRHQDEDGRWNGGIARYDDGTPVKGDTDFTVHCPPGETCFGECAYWEADTALTGLALLTYLGAGYTHSDGRYADVVGKGLEFLIEQQKPNGDLRGRSQVVGMYCHAMATLALCESYALTGDARVRGSAERAVAFLVRARARDGMAWRYAPGAPAGDTSILGWVVMGLKSAKEVGIAIPGEPSVRRGTLLWLEKVATGQSQGLARYQPWEPVTPTMTAEAWVCRQFLGVGGPGPASSEAAEFLLQNDSDRGTSNVYYWYYATLALYQHGGEPWSKWNAKIRDRIVGLQSTVGHQTGSWEPDRSLYGAKGGRIYCTTLAALSLEVYYRYLRLYDAPKIPLEAGAAPERRQAKPPRSVPATATSNYQNR